MTREEASNILDDYDINFEGHAAEEITKAFDVASRALEQESILDNVIEEIMDTGAYEHEVNGKTEFLKGINYCLGVIDKYKAQRR